MVAGNIHDTRALAGFPQELLDHDIVRRRPVPYAFEPPTIDNVANQKDRFGVIMFQQAEQLFGLATTRSEVNVGKEQRFHALGGF